MRATLYSLIALFLIINNGCSQQKKSDSINTNVDLLKKNIENVTTYKLPEKLELLGEKIPLEIPEVRERAEREFFLLLQQPGQIILYLKRAGKLFPMYERIIRENDMPDDLKFLSVAESALYMAQSTKGAVGLWQLMDGTAKNLGLQVDEYVDERRHPEKSTRAAMKYLKDGYKTYKSWLIALGGYNMGHENIQSSMRFQSGEDYFDLYLNEETSRFIFRIALIKEIMENPTKYGFNIPKEEIYRPDKTKIIKCRGAIPDLSVWAKANGTTYKYVKLLNPWILARELKAPKNGRVYEIAVPNE
jgi:membrane-bound lytic murein transglycosylase D